MKTGDFVKSIGPFPEKCQLNPAILESVDCGSYIREKVEYNVENGERISSYLLVPKKRTLKTPVIFCHHQHAGNFSIGKSERGRACDVQYVAIEINPELILQLFF